MVSLGISVWENLCGLCKGRVQAALGNAGLEAGADLMQL